jgi:hypothetical protein
VADPHAADVADRVARSRSSLADRDPEVARPDGLLGAAGHLA